MTWDVAQQYVRIALYAAAGALVQRGYITAEWGDWAAGSALAAANLLWTHYWNKKRA